VNTNNLKRIKVLLPPRVYAQLSWLAARRGIPLTKIVSYWIQETNRLDILIGNTYTQKRSTVLELRMHTREAGYLENLANSLGISRSTTVTRIIEFNLSNQPEFATDSSLITNAWQTGMFRNLPAGILERLEALDYESIHTLIRVYIETGFFDLAQNLIDHFDNSPGLDPAAQRFQGLLHICKSRMARSRKDLDGTRAHALEALRIGEALRDDQLIGLANFRLGIFELGKSELVEGLTYFEKSAAHLPIRQDPFVFLQIYLMRALIAAARFDDEHYRIYAGLSANLLASHPNAYFQAYSNSIYLQQAYLNNEQDVFAKAIQNVELAKASGSVLMSYDANEFAGMVGTTSELNHNQVAHLLNDAYYFESRFRPEMKTSNVRVFQLINMARTDYINAVPQLQRSRLAISKAGSEPEYFSYLFSAADYVYSTDSDVRNNSRQQLSKLQSTSKTDFIQAAANHTLEQRELAPVIM
jgi:hypothetical protein